MSAASAFLVFLVMVVAAIASWGMLRDRRCRRLGHKWRAMDLYDVGPTQTCRRCGVERVAPWVPPGDLRDTVQAELDGGRHRQDG
jgi:hypothetical protein